MDRAPSSARTLPVVANANPLDEAKDLQAMLVSYAKQETIEPLKELGKYLAFGLAGSLLVFLGVLFIGLSVLRALQSETGTVFDGQSFASMGPYAASILVMGLLIALLLRAMSKAKKAVQ